MKKKPVSKCNKWCSLIKLVVGRNITLPSKKELDNVQSEYGDILNVSEISNGIDEIYDVWDEYDYEKVTDKKRGKYHNSLISNDNISLSVSKKISKNLN